MVIVHRGRKTGRRRRTPVNFTRVGQDLFCTAAYGVRADWYLNILENPAVEIWSPEGWWEGVAEDVTEVENAAEILRKVLIGSGFAARFCGLNPYELPENELEDLLRN
jgi:deazaflavin-dependent oxidoreductase (nitroreductase family)